MGPCQVLNEESGCIRKLSRPWHGPFKSQEDPDVTVATVCFPGDAPIRVHHNRVPYCPKELPAVCLWYSGKRKGKGKLPNWVEKLLHGKYEPSSE